jgi:tRNA-guanine family transglycosylase
MRRFINFLATPDLYYLPGHRVDAVMINYPHYLSTPGGMRGTQEILKTANPRFVFMDSGGFQKLSAEIKRERSIGEAPLSEYENMLLNLSPETIVDAAARLRPTAMMALDAPIRKIPDHDAREKEFRKKFNRNVRWAIETAELTLKRCPEVGLFLPVQCYTLQHLEEFMKAIRGIQLNGLSLPIRGMNLLEVALFLLRFHQNGIRNVHLLGVSAFFPMALAAYFGRHFFHWVSLDAQTWRQSAIHNDYTSPHDLTSVEINERVVIPEGTILDCPCPFCRGKTFSYFKNLPYKDRRMLLGCHSWWVTEKTAEKLYASAESIMALRNHLLRRTTRLDKVDELCLALELAESFKNQDLRYLEDLHFKAKRKGKSPKMNRSDQMTRTNIHKGPLLYGG